MDLIDLAAKPALDVLQAMHLPADPLHREETINGIPVYRREHKILQEQAIDGRTLSGRDERLFEQILADDAVQLGVGQIETGCAEGGVEVRPGRQDSEAARRAADAVSAWLDSFDDLGDLIGELVAYVPNVGWSPYVLTWSEHLQVRGVGRVLSPQRIERLEPHRHAVTRPVGELPSLLATRWGLSNGVLAEGYPYRFAWFSRGSTRSPYGKARLAHLVPIFAAKQALLSLMPDFIKRSLGITTLKHSGEANEAELAKRASALYKVLSETNILVGDAKWDPSAVQGTRSQSVIYQVLLETFNGILTSGSVLQNLSSSVKEGALASTKEHVGTILGGVKRDHAVFASKSLTQLATLYLGANRLLPTDPRDCPKVRLGILHSIPLAASLDLWEAGLDVDLGAVADRNGIPYRRDADGNAIIRETQSPLSLFPGVSGRRSTEPPSGRERTARRGMRRTLLEDPEAGQRLADQVHERAPDLDPVADLARSIRDLYGDRDPKAPPR